jgi:hypothetical protein
MVWMYATDSENHLTLSEGFVPELAVLRSRFPKRSEYLAQSQQLSGDPNKEVAWLLTAFAQRIAALCGYGDSRFSLETWLVGPPLHKGGRLTSWFDGHSDDLTYRVMIHRKPPQWSDHIWDKVYDRLRIRHRKGRYAQLKPPAQALLDDLLGSLSNGERSTGSILGSV